MPFASEAQRRFLWMVHPEVAKKWAHEYPGQGPSTLPMHVGTPKEKVVSALMAKRHG